MNQEEQQSTSFPPEGQNPSVPNQPFTNTSTPADSFGSPAKPEDSAAAGQPVAPVAEQAGAQNDSEVESARVQPTTQSAPAASPMFFDTEPASQGTSAFATSPAIGADQSTTQPTPPAKQGGAKKFIIGGAIAVVLVGLLGGGAYAYTAVYQKPENVVLEAAQKALSANKLRTKTTVTSDFTYDADGTKIKFAQLTFDTGAERAPRVDNTAELKMTYNDKAVDLKADVLATDDGTLYFRVNNIIDTLKKVLPTEMKLTAKAESYLQKVDGKWAKYSIADLKNDSPEYGKFAQCTLDVYKKYKDDKKAIQELSDLYKKNPFVTVKESAKSKDGNMGYVIDIDKTRSKAFDKASEQTILSKELKACDPNASTSTQTDTSDAFDTPSTSDGPKTVTTIWISMFTHELRSVDTVTSGIDGINNSKFSVTTHTDVDFKNGVKTSTPTDAQKAKDWAGNLTSAYQEMSSGMTGSIEAKASDASAQSMANFVSKKAEAYNVINGKYPSTIADFATSQESQLDAQTAAVVSSLPQDSEHVAYKKCSTDSGAQVVYRKSDGAYVAMNLGRTGGDTQTVTALCK